VSSKHAFEPIEYGGQEHEVQKMEIGFVIARPNAAKPFNALKEVFHAVPAPKIVGVKLPTNG
jgi:hypothetical protein